MVPYDARNALFAGGARGSAATASQTKVLLASIRDVPAVVALARHGVECFTVGPAVADQFFADELTADAVRTFENAVLATSP